MSRDALRARLRAYRARHPEESATVSRFDAFVATHEDCFHRSCRPGHVTGSAWVVDPSGQRVLLTHHRKLGRWLQLGGHCDGDPDTLAVALREAQEESGLPVRALDGDIFDLDVHLISARFREPAHQHFDVRYLVTVEEDRFRVSGESHALRWVPVASVHELTVEESILRMARKWRAHGAGRSGLAPGGRSPLAAARGGAIVRRR